MGLNAVALKHEECQYISASDNLRCLRILYYVTLFYLFNPPKIAKRGSLRNGTFDCNRISSHVFLAHKCTF